MQYKYKVMRRIVNHTIRLKKCVMGVFEDNKDDPIFTPLLESLMPNFTNQKREQFYDYADSMIKKCYDELNNPARFKK